MRVINVIVIHELPKAHYHNSSSLPKWGEELHEERENFCIVFEDLLRSNR